MLVQDLFLTEVVSIDSPGFRAWFGHSKVVDAHGRPLPVYHGTGRPDRVGTRFRKTRATAGPMAYFTDDPQIASGYASGKPDTSHDPDVAYEHWVTLVIAGKKVPISAAWWQLSSAERQTMAARAPHVTNEEDDIIFDPEAENGVGNYQYALRQERGNVLMALVDGWLTSGALFDNESEFAKVLHLAGLTHRAWIASPRDTMPFVYQVFLSIQNPLVSTAISPAVVEALAAVAAKQHGRPATYDDQWNKKNVIAREWMARLLDEISREHSWTVIPDWVTQTLRSMGYDGIMDVGGKNGGPTHTVWIPFDERQVKSALSNKNFSGNKAGIHQ